MPAKPAAVHHTPQTPTEFDRPLETEEVSPEQDLPSPGFEPEPIETEEVSPIPFDPLIEDHMDGRKRKKKSKKNKKEKKKSKGDKKSHSQRNRGGSNPDQFQPFEAGSPVSPEDFGPISKVRIVS